MSLEARLSGIRSRVAAAATRVGRDPCSVELLAVSKHAPIAAIRAAQALGQRDFGESRIQDLSTKAASITGVRWHGIGRLQTNKVRRAVGLLDVFHALDRLKLARVLSRELARIGRSLPVYVEVNLSGELQKAGFAPEACAEAVAEIRGLPGLEVVGLMGMAPWHRDAERARPHFRRLRQLAEQLSIPGLSMGMSADFEVAIEEGASIIRVGSALFQGEG